MIVHPRIMRNTCVNAHPVGCERQVRSQIDYVRNEGSITGPSNVLIIGASNGYGLAARIVSAFASGASTLGIAYELPATEHNTASAGWYNDRSFLKFSNEQGLAAWSINGDAFADEIKQQAISHITQHMGRIDLLIYSIAAPRRIDPVTKEIFSSVLKPIGEPYRSHSLDFKTGALKEVTLEAATDEEVQHTVKVMGGEDWKLWTNELLASDCLAPGAKNIAFSYIGPEMTAAIYRNGSIGKAKEDLERTAGELGEALKPLGGEAIVSINKALVTRASAVIPGVTLYISLLYKVMKSKGIHENCIQQMYRLFRDYLYTQHPLELDAQGRIRLDDWEMRADVQQEVRELWKKVGKADLEAFSDIEGFREEFLRHHGFGVEGVDYSKAVEL